MTKEMKTERARASSMPRKSVPRNANTYSSGGTSANGACYKEPRTSNTPTHTETHPKAKIFLVDAPELFRLLDGDEVLDGVDHDGGEHKLGESAEEGREHQEREKHHDPRDEARKLRLGTGAVVHGGAGEGTSDRVAGKARTGQIAHPQGEHLPPRVEVVGVL